MYAPMSLLAQDGKNGLPCGVAKVQFLNPQLILKECVQGKRDVIFG